MKREITDLKYYKKTYPFNTFSTRLIKTFNIMSISTRILSCMKSIDFGLPRGLAIKGVCKKKRYEYNLTTHNLFHITTNQSSSLYTPEEIYQFSQQPEIESDWIEIQLFGNDGRSHSGIMNLGNICKDKPKSNYKTNEIQTIGKVRMEFGLCSLVWYNRRFWLELNTTIRPLKLNLDLSK